VGAMVRAVRFLFGVTLVTAGTAVAATSLRGFLEGVPAHSGAFDRPGDPMPAAAVAGHAIPEPHAAPLPVAAPPVAPVVEVAPSFPPPRPLPSADPNGLSGPPPLDLAYRSTLALPPPPLLDVASPPPGAVATPVAPVMAPFQPSALERRAATATEIVRDGDDLTAIAVRAYGHPGAATTVFEANRDRIADPALLPVGVPLRLPPVWQPAGSAPAGPPMIAPPQRPARVVVGAGETFDSLARRFYGDPAYAALLFEANRDRVRSPALLTAGTDLRLP